MKEFPKGSKMAVRANLGTKASRLAADAVDLAAPE
jgi:hypothetical protein